MNNSRLALITLPFAALMLLSAEAFSQAPGWMWAKRAGGFNGNNSNERSFSIATDNARNIYITGFFLTYSIVFGNDTLLNAMQGPSVSDDIFIAKYDEYGNAFWGRRAGGLDDDRANALAVDHSGNIVVTGYFQSPYIIFGNDTLFNSGNVELFIAKYDSSGNVLWAKRGGDLGINVFYFSHFSVATDMNDNIFITGSFKSASMTFGSTTLVNDSFPGYDMFLVKYDATGNVIWAKSDAGSNYEYANAVTTDPSGNIIICGEYGGYGGSLIVFDADTLTKTNTGTSAFTVKYDMNGNVIWARSYVYGSNIGQEGKTVVADASGNIFEAGDFWNSAVSAFYVLKYTSSGVLAWDLNYAGPWLRRANSIAVDALGKIILTGTYNADTIKFGSTTLTNMAVGGSDIFIVKYSASGNPLWAKSVGDFDSDGSTSITVDNVGNIAITGYFYHPPFTSSNMIFDNDTLHVLGLDDIFVAKLGFGTIGFEESRNDDLIHVYPNPASDNIVLDAAELSGMPISISVISSIGEEVYNHYLTAGRENPYRIQLPGLSPGIYFLRINSYNGPDYSGKFFIR